MMYKHVNLKTERHERNQGNHISFRMLFVTDLNTEMFRNQE